MNNLQSEPAYGGSTNGKAEIMTSLEAERFLGMCRGYMSYAKNHGLVEQYSTVKSGRGRVSVFLKSDVVRLKDNVQPKPYLRGRRRRKAAATKSPSVPQPVGSDARVERLARKMASLGVTPNGIRSAALKIGLDELERQYA